MKFDISEFFEKYVEKLQFSLQSDKMSEYLHEDYYTYSILSYSFLLRNV
jgi:hypothetical protein